MPLGIKLHTASHLKALPDWWLEINHTFIVGSCSVNQECIHNSKCPFTNHLNTLIKLSSNEDEIDAIKQIINSRICGGPLAETVCCDYKKGKTFSVRFNDHEVSGKISNCLDHLTRLLELVI